MVFLVKVLRDEDIPDLKLDPERVWCMAGYADPSKSKADHAKGLSTGMGCGATAAGTGGGL
jgi:hypothetical protein